MDDIFKLLVDVHSDWYSRYSNAIASGLRYGCDCGCGGDSISDEVYQDYMDEYNALESRWQTFLDISELDEDTAVNIIESLDYLEDMPSESYEYTTMDQWSADIRSFGPTVMFAMLDMYRNKPNIIKEYYENI